MKNNMKWVIVEKKDGYTIVKAIAEIRNNETGEIREYKTDEYILDGDEFPNVFNWEENNFSCDCNRKIFFNSAIGKDTENAKCGHGKYSVNLKNPVNNYVYYREFNNGEKK